MLEPLKQLVCELLEVGEEELKCTEHLLYARRVEEISFVISFNLPNNSET